MSKNGIDVSGMKKAYEEGRLDEFVNKNLSASATKRLKEILADREATDKLLATPQAKELMKKLKGDK
jgi:hypothetical protein